MKRKNKTLLLILLIFVITIVVILILKTRENTVNPTDKGVIQEIEDNEEVLRYDNANVSYLDYYKDGKIDVDVKKYVKLPENYLEGKITNKNEIDSIFNKIVEESEVEFPIKLLNGYYGDLYNSEKIGSQLSNKSLDDYIKDTYGYESYQQYAEEFMKYIKKIIKTDLVYQALAERLNITITKQDIENYYSEKLANGETYESIKERYGEKAMYQNTEVDKIKKVLIDKLS